MTERDPKAESTEQDPDLLPLEGEPVEASRGETTAPLEPTTDHSGPANPPSEKRGPDKALPSSFGRYEVRGTLGKGGFGTVYIGHDSQLDRAVAIKVKNPKRKARADEVDQFLQEARRVARLKHPGIVAVYDVGVQENQVYIVCDFVNGRSLADWLMTVRPTWQQAVRITAAVADALAHAHTLRVVHRDVKPANIILAEELTPVLVDFGLGLDESAAGGALVGLISGSPSYMSPEQASGAGHRIDGRTDIYSLVVVLYQMLCGRRPFVSADQEELRQVREDEPQPPRQLVPKMPRELERVCLKAMSKRIAERYTSAGDFAEELRLVLAGDSTTVATPPVQPVVAVEPPSTLPDSGQQPAIHERSSTHPGFSSSERRAREAERRQLTMMLCSCDLSDSTESLEDLDPETQHELLREYQQVCSAEASRFGGMLVPTSGPGVLVCFGYPEAFEDAGQRGVRAGLRILSAMLGLNERLQKQKRVRLSVSVVIHTCLVVVGETGASKAGEPISIVGEARNVVARLENVAQPNAVVISGQTYRLVRGFFLCESLGSHSIKGLSRQLDVYKVVRESQVSGRIDAAGPNSLTPLIGRDFEVGLL